MPTINDIQELRDRAEAATDLREIWKATLKEVSARWLIAGQPDDSPPDEVELMWDVCRGIRAGDRVLAINRIEQWRSAWLNVMRQRDHTSTARLNVIDSFRRMKE